MAVEPSGCAGPPDRTLGLVATAAPEPAAGRAVAG
jgi:hypothetical protein